MSVQRRERGGKVRWVARYRGSDRRERSRTFDTRREAVRWVAERERELHRGEWTDPSQGLATVREVTATWARLAERPSTRRARRTFLANLGPLAEVPLARLTRTDIEEWLAMLAEPHPWASGKPLAVRSRQLQLIHLKTVLNRAIADGRIHSNPAKGIRPPAGLTPEKIIPTADEVRRLIAQTDGTDLGMAIRVMAATGLRLGEALGLTHGSVDIAGRKLHVTAQAAREGTGLAPLKTAASRRTVTVDGSTISALDAWLPARPGRLFLHDNGVPLSKRRVQERFPRAARAAGLPAGVTPHSLRHFHATALLRAGVPVKTVQHRLGHATAAVTLETYAHAIPSDDQAAANLIEGVLRGTGAGR